MVLIHATPKLNFYSQNIRMFLYKTWGCSSAEHGDVFTHNIPMFYMYILHKFCPRYIYPFRHILYYNSLADTILLNTRTIKQQLHIQFTKRRKPPLVA